MSKGLGAPVGSLLVGDAENIRMARRYRKVMGGGMRQAGYLAAACIFALDHHIPNLKTDNYRAKKIAEVLSHLNYVKELKPVSSNIVILKLQDDIRDTVYLEKLRNKGILASPFGDNTIRFVTHADITEGMIDEVLSKLPKIM